MCSCEDDVKNNSIKNKTIPVNQQKINTVKPADSTTYADALPAAQVKGRKGKRLQSLIGLYELIALEASVGANGMIDYDKVGSEWQALGSSISDGMRESYDITLEKKTLKSLNCLKLEVDNNFTVRLLMDNTTLIELPYKENEMTYQLINNGANYISLPDNITKSSSFSGSHLYLMASDNVNKGILQKIDLLGLSADVLVLRYNLKEAQFELNLFVGECCDNSFYKFKRINN
jgi:hypothetical protein